MIQQSLKMDINKLARLLIKITEQYPSQKSDFFVVKLLVGVSMIHMFVPLPDNKTAFVYTANVSEAFIKPVSNNAKIYNGKPVTLVISLQMIEQILKKCELDKYYIVTTEETSSVAKEKVFTISLVNPLNNVEVLKYCCGVDTKKYRENEKIIQGFFNTYLDSVQRNVLTQTIKRETLEMLFNIYVEMPMSGFSDDAARIMILTDKSLEYCNGPAIFYKQWKENPFEKLTSKSFACLAIDAIAFLANYINTDMYTMEVTTSDLKVLTADVNNITVGFVWRHHLADMLSISNLSANAVASDLKNLVVQIKLSDLQKIARSGLRKFARGGRCTTDWTGQIGTQIMLCNYNKNEFDCNNLVTDVWGLPPRRLSVAKLQAVVRLLKMYKVKNVTIFTCDVQNKCMHITFSNEDKSLCITLCAVRPHP